MKIKTELFKRCLIDKFNGRNETDLEQSSIFDLLL